MAADRKRGAGGEEPKAHTRTPLRIEVYWGLGVLAFVLLTGVGGLAWFLHMLFSSCR